MSQIEKIFDKARRQVDQVGAAMNQSKLDTESPPDTNTLQSAQVTLAALARNISQLRDLSSKEPNFNLRREHKDQIQALEASHNHLQKQHHLGRIYQCQQ